MATVTVITLYRGRTADTYVAVYDGELSADQEREIAYALDLALEDGEALDTLGFQTVETEAISPVMPAFILLNAYPDERTWTGEEA
jgi:hypothetical protein